METLREIGVQLDQNRFPRVYNGGIVAPCDPALFQSPQGQKEKTDEKQGKRRPEPRPWPGASGWQRSARRHRSGKAGRAAPVISTNLRAQYESQLDSVHTAYPGAISWRQEEGMWLLTESTLLPGLGKKATFLTAIPYTYDSVVRGWGFWTSAVFQQWIGPRHTNFPDGSICAFDPEDKTWIAGGQIVKLLDIYTLWALRQLHLEKIGHWPGYQSVHYPYERLAELKDDEHCGCSNSHMLYKDCCKRADLSRDRGADALDFLQRSGGVRQPPESVIELMKSRRFPASVKDVTFF